jgi:hypothetical protein
MRASGIARARKAQRSRQAMPVEMLDQDGAPVHGFALQHEVVLERRGEERLEHGADPGVTAHRAERNVRVLHVVGDVAKTRVVVLVQHRRQASCHDLERRSSGHRNPPRVSEALPPLHGQAIPSRVVPEARRCRER